MGASDALRAGAIAIGVVAIAPATWRIAELLPTAVQDGPDADYAWGPPHITNGVAIAIGVVGLALATMGGVVAALAIRGDRIRRGWIGVLAPLVALAAYVGVGYSVLTTPVIGANIGGGLVLLGAIPAAIGLISATIFFARRLLRRTDHRAERSARVEVGCQRSEPDREQQAGHRQDHGDDDHGDDDDGRGGLSESGSA